MIRVLFVDDDTHVLDGLRRTLRPLAHRWDMVFASDGHAAMAALREQRLDVLVTDLSMPDVNGFGLLEHAFGIAPRTIRIVLSGQAGLKRVARVSRLAHRVISKPCERDVLVALVERSCAIRDLREDHALGALVAGLALPLAAPPIYAALTALGGGAPTDDIAARIAASPTVAPFVIDMARIYAESDGDDARGRAHARGAVETLGPGVLAPILLLGELSAMLARRAMSEMELRSHNRRALLVARSARRIRGMMGSADEEIFAAGLLHDIGTPLVVAAQRAGLVADPAADLAPRLAAHLLARWGLPHGIIEAVAHHRCPAGAGLTASETIAATHIACFVAGQAAASSHVDDGSSDSAVAALDAAYLDSMGLGALRLEWQQIAAEYAVTTVA